MRDETHNETHDVGARPVAAANGRQAAGASGATVSIPPRPRPATPFGPTTLHARLALLRPQPVRLRPTPGSET
jgi:hypothetical protein